MEKITSLINEGQLLHFIFRGSDISKTRLDLCPEEEFLQLSCFELEEGATFKPHKHIIHEKVTNIAQESWVGVNGSVEVTYYDLDDRILCKKVLNSGDVSVTFRGGHNYKILSPTAKVYEFKTGPYLGQEYDKVFI
jgi:hypothetical protein